jgi:alpha-glucosidase (family GH31 glycosyl hydrolase)
VGGTCGTHGRGMCTGFWWESQKERDHLEDQGIDGIRMDLREIDWGSVHWIQLAQNRDRWRAVVNTVMNLRVMASRS